MSATLREAGAGIAAVFARACTYLDLGAYLDLDALPRGAAATPAKNDGPKRQARNGDQDARTENGNANTMGAGTPAALIAGIAAVFLAVAALMSERERRAALRRLDEASEALARSEGMRARFIEAVAHDLRQPLQAAELFSAGLERKNLDPGALPMLDGIRSALASMRRMLAGLMDVSRLDSGAVAPELRDVAAASLFGPIAAEFAPAAEARGIAFSVAVPDAETGAALRTDPVMLECILRNLIGNAVRYTDVGGVAVRCAMEAASSRFAITVGDTGPGIAETELGRIFQEFYRVPGTAHGTDGLGLGLAIVRRMARLLDLPLEISSALGQGTVFTLLVPAAPSPAASGPASMPVSMPASMPVDPSRNTFKTGAVRAGAVLAGARVLLVDDDGHVRRALAGELFSRGMAVTAVASAEAAFALFSARPPESGPQGASEDVQNAGFDIALVDHDLGGAFTGPELLNHLAAASGIAVPALLLSGTQDFRVIAALQECGTPWLSKPVDIEVLLREMARLMTIPRA